MGGYGCTGGVGVGGLIAADLSGIEGDLTVGVRFKLCVGVCDSSSVFYRLPLRQKDLMEDFKSFSRVCFRHLTLSVHWQHTKDPSPTLLKYHHRSQ